MAARVRGGVRQAHLRAETGAMDIAAAARTFPAHRATSGGLMGMAYPTPHPGSHKGVPLRCAFGVHGLDSPGHFPMNGAT